MKPLAHRSPSNKGAFCWARMPPKDGGCTSRLMRVDSRREARREPGLFREAVQQGRGRPAPPREARTA